MSVTKAKAAAVMSLLVVGGGWFATTEVGGGILRGIFPLSRPGEYGGDGRPTRLLPSWYTNDDVKSPSVKPTSRVYAVTVVADYRPDTSSAIMRWNIGPEGADEVIGGGEHGGAPPVSRTGYATVGETVTVQFTDFEGPADHKRCKIIVDGRPVVDAPTNHCIYTIH